MEGLCIMLSMVFMCIIIVIIIIKTGKNKAVYTPIDEEIKIDNKELLNDLVLLVNHRQTKITPDYMYPIQYKDNLSEKKVEYLYNKLLNFDKAAETYISSEFLPYIEQLLQGRNYNKESV